MSDLYFLTAGNLAGVTMSVFELLGNLHEQRRLQGLIADALIQKYLVKRARMAGLTVTDEDRQRVIGVLPKDAARVPDPAALEREILVAKFKERITAEPIKKRFKDDPSRFDRLHVRHLVVDNEDSANGLREQLNDPSVSFAELARRFTKHDPSRNSGGDMGVAFRHALPPRVAEAVVGAKSGDVIGPLKLETAYSILKVEKLIPAEMGPQLMALLVDEAFDAWLKSQLKDEMMDFPLIARIQHESSPDEPPDQIRI